MPPHYRAMTGMDATTGRTLSGIDHLRQSIRDILTTPIGTRVMRRDYGSRLYRLVDAPMNSGTILDLYAATAEALATWEPRVELKSVALASASYGRVVLDMVAEYRPEGRDIRLDGIEVTA